METKEATTLKPMIGKLLNAKLGFACVVILCAVAACTVAFAGQKGAFAAGGDGGNSWQIVSGEYDATHQTSQGLSDSDLGKCNFAASDDGEDGSQVHVTKTVEPTGVEVEFIVHLSVDTSATSKKVTDFYTFFTNAPYEGTTSNMYDGKVEPGGVTAKEAGTMGVSVSGTTKNKNQGVFDIYDPQKHLIAKSVTLYWDQANNITILLNVGKLLGTGDLYVAMGLGVKKDTTNDLYLSQEAYDKIKEAIQGETNWGDPTRLASVTDVMGDEVEYIGGASADGGTTTYDDSSRKLTWNPQYSNNYTEVFEESKTVTETNEYDAVTKVTITQRKWLYGAASLTYRVRLNTQASGFVSSYDPNSVTNPYLTNNNATLNYSYSVDGGQTYNPGSVDFPQPQVKGVRYDLNLLKTNEIQTPLAGATFKLTRAWTDSFGRSHTDLILDDLVSDSDGLVTATSLPWGTYTLTEIAAPSGHTMCDDYSVTFNLSYTTNSENLAASTLSNASEHHAMLSGSTPTVVNERVKTNVTLLKVDSGTSDPLAGARFALYADNGDGTFDEATNCTDAQKVAEGETASDGTLKFSQLTVGTYYLKETYTPAGYELNGKVYRIDVYDVKGAAGGSDDNMIRVGDTDGPNMQAPNTPNQITIADQPVPTLPMTAGPGVQHFVGCGAGFVCIGVLCAASSALHQRRRLSVAKHRAG